MTYKEKQKHFRELSKKFKLFWDSKKLGTYKKPKEEGKK
jgi:hypothetical protein